MEMKSADGTAALTDTHLVFEFNALGRVAKGAKRAEFPLDEIVEYEFLFGSINYVRIFTSGDDELVDPGKSPSCFALHPRKPHDAFISALAAATGATERNAGGDPRVKAAVLKAALKDEAQARKAAASAERAETRAAIAAAVEAPRAATPVPASTPAERPTPAAAPSAPATSRGSKGKPGDIGQFRYKNGVLIRSAATSWRPGKWALGPGTTATVAAGASNGFLAAPVFLTVTTPAGEVIVIQAWGKDAAKAHKLAAQIQADSSRS